MAKRKLNVEAARRLVDKYRDTNIKYIKHLFKAYPPEYKWKGRAIASVLFHFGTGNCTLCLTACMLSDNKTICIPTKCQNCVYSYYVNKKDVSHMCYRRKYYMTYHAIETAVTPDQFIAAINARADVIERLCNKIEGIK